MTNLLDGKKLSNDLTLKLKKEISNTKQKLQLVVISIDNDLASKVYINMKRKKCLEVGILFQHITLEENVEESKVISIIEKLNKDKNVTSILLQLPIPKHLNKDKIINSIDPIKDVDGLTNLNMIKIINNEPSIIPCTPKGIISLMKYNHIEIAGKNIVIINRSKLIGIPLFHLLLNENATVTMCHSHTNNLKKITKKADIIISAIGKKDFINKSMIKKNSIVIDVGITRINNQIYGDVNFNKVKNKASLITPVPNGIGPMTVISLIENIIACQKMS